MKQHEKSAVIRQLAQIAEMIEGDMAVGFSLNVVFPNNDVTSIGSFPPARAQGDKLIQSMDRALFRFKMVVYGSGARVVGSDEPPTADDADESGKPL